MQSKTIRIFRCENFAPYTPRYIMAIIIAAHISANLSVKRTLFFYFQTHDRSIKNKSQYCHFNNKKHQAEKQ